MMKKTEPTPPKTTSTGHEETLSDHEDTVYRSVKLSTSSSSSTTLIDTASFRKTRAKLNAQTEYDQDTSLCSWEHLSPVPDVIDCHETNRAS